MIDFGLWGEVNYKDSVVFLRNPQKHDASNEYPDEAGMSMLSGLEKVL